MKKFRDYICLDQTEQVIRSEDIVDGERNIVYTCSPTSFRNVIADRDDVKNYVVVTNNPTEYHRKFISNNIIDARNKDKTKILKEINWVLSGFGRNVGSQKTDTWFVSDLHLNHRNIIKYCNRPWNSGMDENGNIVVTDEDVERMNEDLIRNWNSVVGKNDVVYNLGDFALGDRSRIPEFVSRLNGKINLVMGNHDWFHVRDDEKYSGVVDFLYKSGFNRVYDRPILFEDFFILSHEPIPWSRNGLPYANLFGHVHNQETYASVTQNTYNCCVEVNDYRPVSFDHVKKAMEEKAVG